MKTKNKIFFSLLIVFFSSLSERKENKFLLSKSRPANTFSFIYFNLIKLNLYYYCYTLCAFFAPTFADSLPQESE